MFELIEAKSVPLTRDLVEDHFNMKPSPTERPLDPARLNYLRERYEAGQLVTFHWAAAQCAQMGDAPIRMNGQHSSTFLHELNGELPEGLIVHRDLFKVDQPSELAVLFRQFDARKSSRTPADVAGAYQGLYDSLADVPRDLAKLAVDGIAWWQKHVIGTRNKLDDDRYTLFDDQRHHPFIRWIGELHSAKTPELRPTSVMAAIYATFDVNEEEAQSFWQLVARGGEQFDENHPSTVLDVWLADMKDAEKRRRAKVKPANLYQGCVYGWNAHRSGKSIRDIRSKVDKELLEPIS